MNIMGGYTQTHLALIYMALSVITYNCKGFQSSSDYIKDVILESKPLIMCLQETWHLQTNVSAFASLSPEYMFYDTSGVDCSESILAGRPYGGLAIFYKRSIAHNVKHIKTQSRRCCAVLVHEENCVPLMIINVYMPCDNYSTRTVCQDFCDVIAEIEELLNDYDGAVLLCGDWNTDPTRSTAQTSYFHEFVERNHLHICWDHQNASVQPTYANDALHHYSCIDHFVMSSNLYNTMVACDVNSCPLNPSDHRDIAI